MLKRTVVICVCMLLMVNVLTTILIDNDSVVSASSTNQEGLPDYYFMYRVIENLTKIIFNKIHGVDHGIYKGRNFGTAGEQYAAQLLRTFIVNETKNLNSNLVLERIGNDSYGYSNYYKQRIANNNLEILGYGLSFRNTTSGPPNATIPLNETYPFPNFTSKEILEFDNVSTDNEYYTVEFDPLAENNIYDDLVNQYNISYEIINATENLVAGDIIFIEDYQKTIINQTVGKSHLINVSDEDLNDTIEMLIQNNASGFILMRNNISHIKNWTLNMPGIAVSTENGSFLANLTKNGSVWVIPNENSEQNTLQVFHYNFSNLPIGDKKIYLINQSFVVDNWGWFITRNNLIRPAIRGFIFFNSNYPNMHFHYPSATISYGPDKSYSKLKIPAFSINGSILINGQMRNFEQWVRQNENTNHPVRARFYIDQQKNDKAISYNVYCNIQGKNPNKYFLLSGGHYEAWPGQSMTDDASGVGIMMGILKYFNDSHITPKYNLQFIFHGGHENVARGSKSHTYNLTNTWILKHTEYMINLDMLAHYFQYSWFRINCSSDHLARIVREIVDTSWYNNTFQRATSRNEL